MFYVQTCHWSALYPQCMAQHIALIQKHIQKAEFSTGFQNNRNFPIKILLSWVWWYMHTVPLPRRLRWEEFGAGLGNRARPHLKKKFFFLKNHDPPMHPNLSPSKNRKVQIILKQNVLQLVQIFILQSQSKIQNPSAF